MTNAVSIEKSKIEETEINATSQTSEYKEPSKKKIIFTMVLSFIVPAIIMALAFLKVRVYPGGKFTVLIYDMQAQFMPICASLRYLGHSQHSLLYSFYGALGNNALLNYKTYFANPLFWLTTLFPLEKLPDVLYFITIFFIGLCGLSFCTFLLYGSKSNRLRRYPVAALILSCCYALMSFNVAYSMCINWLLEVALLPLMLIGIEHIIEGKKGAVYLLAMTYAVYNSDQLFFMSGIFCVLYLIYRLSEIEENRVRIVVRFGICSLLAFGLSMPIVLPMLFNIKSGRIQTNILTEHNWFYYPTWSTLKQLLSCQYDTFNENGLPFIFCGTFVPLFTIVGIVTDKVKIRTKIISAVIVLFYFVSFSLIPLNRFWHGLIEPSGFPVRYAYTFCALLLVFAYKSVDYIYRRINIPKDMRGIIVIAVSIISFFELYVNAGFVLLSNNLSSGYENRLSYDMQIEYTKDILAHIEDDGFYRIGRDSNYSNNDGMIFGYNGIAYFSSMFERGTMDFIGMLGYSQNEHSLRDFGGSPLAESLLGVKYKIIKDVDTFWNYDRVYSNGYYELEKNEDALPVGFMIREWEPEEDEDKDLWEGIEEHNSFAFQNFILSDFSGKRVNAFNDILCKKIEDNSGNITKYKFTAPNNEPVWLYGCVKKNTSEAYSEDESDSSDKMDDLYLNLKVNGTERCPFVDSLSEMCTYIGTFSEGEEVIIEIDSPLVVDRLWVAYLDMTILQQAMDSIRENSFTVESVKSGTMIGNIHIDNDNSPVVFTLPYMNGYKIRVDGDPVEYSSYRDRLLAMRLDRGSHTIDISFTSYGLIPGIIICLVSLVLNCIYLSLKSIKQQ